MSEKLRKLMDDKLADSTAALAAGFDRQIYGGPYARYYFCARDRWLAMTAVCLAIVSPYAIAVLWLWGTRF